MLHLPPVASAIAAFLGVALAVFRLLTASKAFWWKFPEKVQKGLPAVLVALGVLPTALGSAKTWTDFAVALLFVVGTYFTASRGDKRPVEPPANGAMRPRVKSDPKTEPFDDVTPPSLPGAALVGLCLCLLLVLPGCASWKPIARTADGLAEAACGQFFGEKQGISIEEAARQFCATQDDLRPWIDQVLAMKQAAGKAALARRAK